MKIRNVFSLPVMCYSLLAVATFFLSLHAFPEPDIWWHLRNGTYLLNHHAIPRVDYFSFSAAGSAWLNYEWLSEIPFALGMRAMGLSGVLLVYVVVLWLIYGGIYYLACRTTDCKSAAVVTLLAVALGKVSFGPRTLLFGWLCMVGLLIVLERFQRTGKSLWLLPPLFALWINLHGSWVFGMAVFAIMIAGGLMEGEWGKVVARRWKGPELKRLLTYFLASTIALFLTPFGYKLMVYPLSFLLHQQTNISNMNEWQPVFFNEGNGKLVLVILAALFALMLFSNRKWKLTEVLLTAFALWAALSHVRFLFFLGIILAPVLASKVNLFPPYERKLDRPWLNAAIITAAVAAVVLCFPSGQQLEASVSREYPRAALTWMQQQKITGRVFNLYLWGGYMEWNAPELKPFIDGRADIFVYNGVFDNYGRAVRIVNPLEVMGRYRIEYVLFATGEPLCYVLDHAVGWHLIYSDPIARLYQRDNAPASLLETQ